MTPETQDNSAGLSVKRIGLIIVTCLVAVVMGQSLFSSWSEPQVANRLQLYQTDLLLAASHWSADELPAQQQQMIRQSLLGVAPLESALEQYQEVRKAATQALEKLQTAEAAASEQENRLSRRSVISQQQTLLHQLDLRIGLLQSDQQQTAQAISTWEKILGSETATAPVLNTASDLIQLWRDQAVPPQAETHFTLSLDGWFRYRALEKLYRTTQSPEALQRLLAQEQTSAQAKLLKLALVGVLPSIGSILGALLLIGLIIHQFTQAHGLLTFPGQGRWEIPWNGETIWLVLMVGFFFIGQILLPLTLRQLGLSFSGLSSWEQALFSLVYYLLMAGGGVGVLVWSLWPYRPLPQGLFTIKLRGRWWLWGLGGYLATLPLMLGVGLLNQHIWQGTGGSNPLLQTVLQERDPLALGLFLVTAAIAAPVFEEFLFRGFLLASLTKYLPAGGAIFASSLIFATAHLSLSEVLPLTVLGTVLGIVYVRSRNLLAPILLHSTWNTATMVGLFLLGSR